MSKKSILILSMGQRWGFGGKYGVCFVRSRPRQFSVYFAERKPEADGNEAVEKVLIVSRADCIEFLEPRVQMIFVHTCKTMIKNFYVVGVTPHPYFHKIQKL